MDKRIGFDGKPMSDVGQNIFELAGVLSRIQAEAYRQVREQARNEALAEMRPSDASVRAATLHCKAPSGSFPSYSEIRCMADEILRLKAVA